MREQLAALVAKRERRGVGFLTNAARNGIHHAELERELAALDAEIDTLRRRLGASDVSVLGPYNVSSDVAICPRLELCALCCGCSAAGTG